MDFNEYQKKSKRTMPRGNNKAIANYALGLNGESGEAGDLIKKNIFHGHDLGPEGWEKLKLEFGDVLHYLAGLCTMYGMTLEEVAEANIDKLQRRYKYGFSQEASRNRTE